MIAAIRKLVAINMDPTFFFVLMLFYLPDHSHAEKCALSCIFC